MRSKTLIISAACAVAVIAAGILAADPPVRVVVKKPFQLEDKARHGGGGTTIIYHGGPVLTGTPVNVYVIYYGAVASGTQDIVNQFFTDLSTSPNYAVNSTYNEGPATADIASMFSFATGPYLDAGSQGNSVGSSTVPAIVAHAISTGGLPADEHAVYFVVTGPAVKVAGFCKSFCAYHTSSASIVAGKHIRYALVPDPGQACTGCDGNFFLGQNITPNDDQGADEMTDSIIHELSESVTDPDISAWYSSGGQENGDLCNYFYGSSPLPMAPNGAYYNAKLNKHYYLIQLIWSNAVAPQACLAAPPQ